MLLSIIDALFRVSSWAFNTWLFNTPSLLELLFPLQSVTIDSIVWRKNCSSRKFWAELHIRSPHHIAVYNWPNIVLLWSALHKGTPSHTTAKKMIEDRKQEDTHHQHPGFNPYTYYNNRIIFYIGSVLCDDAGTTSTLLVECWIMTPTTKHHRFQIREIIIN